MSPSTVHNSANRFRPSRPTQLTVTERVSRYWRFAKSCYVKDVKPPSETPSIKLALGFARRLPAATEGAGEPRSAAEAPLHPRRDRQCVLAGRRRCRRAGPHRPGPTAPVRLELLDPKQPTPDAPCRVVR